MINVSFGFVDKETENSSPSPLAGSGPGGHKPSFKSTKLAKRARSFKDDVLEKISQMRSPTNQGIRSQSPKGGRTIKETDVVDSRAMYNKGPIEELDHQYKQLSIALKHFRDVVAKKKLEMLPGNGTIVLDTIWAINLIVQRSIVSPDNTKMVKAATNRMYQRVAKLIKLCDDALIDDQCSALDEQNVEEVLSLLDDAVKFLMKEVECKLSTQHNLTYMTTPRPSHGSTNLDMPAQRNSLPDIPLTPRDLQKLEQSSANTRIVRNSHSTESILRDSSPPPKPPLPHGIYRKESDSFITPPPLPPKKRNLENNYKTFNSDNSIFGSSLERMSLRSRSPEDSSSLLSATGSLDSVLNHSREDEEELNALMDHSVDNETVLESDLSDLTSTNGLNNPWPDDDSFANSHHHNLSLFLNQSNDFHHNRLSNTDSGFMSVQSLRNSSYSKRSSQQSTVSSQWSSQQCYTSSKQTTSSSVTEVNADNLLESHKNFIENQITLMNMRTVTQKTFLSSSEISSNHTSITIGDDVADKSISDESIPPAIPQKTRRKQERQPSPYDNVPESSLGEVLVTCQMHQSHHSLISNSSITACDDGNRPPPLPPKKKHIMAYMEMFGNCSHSNDSEFMRHSVHIQGHWSQSPKPGLPTTQSCSFSHTSSQSSSRSSHTQVQNLTIPYSSGDSSPIPSPLRSPNSISTPVSSSGTPPALPPKRSKSSSSKSSPPSTPQTMLAIETSKSPMKSLPDLLEHTTNNKTVEETPATTDLSCDMDLMEKTADMEKYLVFKGTEDDGPDIRGGCIDALIIQATKATKNGVFAYQEAFLTTYRTFITPYELITKLIRRFNYFYSQPDKKPKEAFALIIRVVSDFTPSDLDSATQQMLMDFVQQLISYGEITLAKALRVKHLERHNAKLLCVRGPVVEPPCPKNPSTYNLLDFKSEQIAEQMTFLDAELFMKIEIPEVLIWAQEQNEERSPNLTRFTEHFNKMSYWARTKILLADAKDRERYFLKFIKIMKHLRKINNFNSYLALLSALDSAPIRRLEWQKHVQEGLKEYCALIDSSSSFRAYRQALAETNPPCIPYIGLVLQDLTFVHIGNNNLLQSGLINFSKRWQQYNIVENMKRFKKCAYLFKRNDKIIDFFQNFDDYITEDEMWARSESIKPRGTKKQA
ncbi:RasGEF domain [Popillia japonica]|uniref:CRK SH3-binding GNRP n=1 Tax=Popillia japonica TaxID=7064 RepID=A0AAW1JE75_POPJA